MTSQNRTRKPRLLPLAVAVGVVAFACWPRGPRLEWYTSRARTSRGEPTRVKMLIPSGWRIHDPGQDHRPLRLGPVAAFLPLSAEATREESLVARLVAWLGGLGHLPGRAEREYLIVSCEPLNHRSESNQADKVAVYREDELFIAIRRVRSGKLMFELMYRRTNRASFEASYRQICESFRVVR